MHRPFLFVGETDGVLRETYFCVRRWENKPAMRMSRVIRAGEINMLEGPLLGKAFAFSLPLMVTNLLQVFYSAADMIVVGLSDVEGALGAIGTTSAMINLILNIFVGFSIGASIVVARNIGRDDRQATENAVHTALLTGLVAGAVCCVVGLIISRPVLVLLGDQGHILELAVLYTRIYFLGVPFLAVANFLIAILRAQGDTRTPLFILTCTGLLNVGLNLLFVLGFGMSVDGVAAATAISNAVSAVLLAIRLRNDAGWCRLSFAKLRFHKTALLDIIRDGLPACVQGALFSLSNMLIQSSIIGLNNVACPGGSDIIDGNAAASSLEGFAYTATNSVYQAAVTFTSQNFGAKKYKRIGSVMGACYFATALIAVLASTLIVVFRASLVGFYVSAPMAMQTAQTRIFVMMIPYFLLAFMEVGCGVLRGLGKSIMSTTISLIGSCLLRIVWLATVFRLSPTLETVYMSYPVSWGLTALIHFTCSILVRRRYIKRAESA